MKKTNIKTNKGITLLALIITIIVLLILATVSIKLLVDNGIIGKAESATSKYTVEEEKEKINLAYADYKMAKAENGTATLTVNDATVSGDETSGWTITFAKTGNRYKFVPSQGTPELKPKTEEESLLEKHFCGENGDVVTLQERLQFPYGSGMDEDKYTFLESDLIPDASTKLGYMYGIHEDIFFKYQDKVYKLQYDINTYENQAVDLVYEPKGKEGQTVKYSYDGKTENAKEWAILYDYGDSVEIISPDVMGDLTLGYDDEEAQTPGDVDKDGTANTNTDKAIYSYNNAINRLNKYCSSLVTNPNKISVRSVGSNPKNPNAESGMYTSERLSQWADGKCNGIGKGTDDNFKEDYIRMSYYGVTNTGDEYWLASRCVNEHSGFYSAVEFCVWRIRYQGDIENNYSLWSVDEDGSWSLPGDGYVRPVVKVKKADVGL